MSDGNKPADSISALKDRLIRDLDTGTQTAKVLWRTTLAPQLRDLGSRVREGSGKATEQAGDVFSGLGKRLRGLGSKLKDG